MPLTTDGILILAGQTIGYTEREVYVSWDIAPDLLTHRFFYNEEGFYRKSTYRYGTHEHIAYYYITRWIHVEYTPTPITERNVYVHYALCGIDSRTCYYYTDTRDRIVFAEGLYTNTPLLLRYPKYYNWAYIPQVLNPEFRVWSYYDIIESDITLKVVSDNATIYVNSGTDPDKFTVIKETNNIYKIKVNVDHVFDPNETVTCYLSLYDVKDNYLKDGMW